MDESAKSAADQVSEIAKLIADAQDKLDQAVRALQSLRQRLAGEPDADLQ